MESVFYFDNYKELVLSLLKKPKSGRARTMRTLAESIRVSPASVSVIFKGSRDLSPEQAYETCEFLNLTPQESEYFLALVEFSRAGTEKLKRFYGQRIRKMKTEGLRLKQRISVDRELNPEEKGIFFSEWYYAAVLVCLSGSPRASIEQLAAFLKIDSTLVKEAIRFLLDSQLVKREGDSILMGTRSIHLAVDDPLTHRNHQNWRVLANRVLSERKKLSDNEMALSLAFGASEATVTEIKKILLSASERSVNKIDTGKSEFLAFLNIDLLKLR